MPFKQKSKSREFCVVTDGVPHDAELHEPILAAGNERVIGAIGRAVAKRAGLTDEEIGPLYPSK